MDEYLLFLNLRRYSCGSREINSIRLRNDMANVSSGDPEPVFQHFVDDLRQNLDGVTNSFCN
ncbi:hypothetical protein DERP_005193 [Dermatophagoides pteronyssinus]|uniref:Uncharacterized protein n=1 Tax=Dermatophagoides pteronyssinus TaxID=6956 RepID=A0ABQ8JLY2_DERPT|nr:hypothetical protein DERP_005193 [Dermatophagoides pteronyssinus]